MENGDESSFVALRRRQPARGLPIGAGACVDISIPEQLQKRLRALCTFPRYAKGPNGELRVSGMGIQIIFHEIETGIAGVPVHAREAALLRHRQFNRVFIEQIAVPQRDALVPLREQDVPHDERGYVIIFLLQGDGFIRHVWKACDELTVLQWLYEANMLPLYKIPVLTNFQILPLRDDDRQRTDQDHDLETSLHRERLFRRLLTVHSGIRLNALEAFRNSSLVRDARET